MKISIPVLLVFTALASGANAAETWLACKGTLATTPANAKAPISTVPSERVMVLNDDLKRVYQWVDARKQMSPLPEKVYSDKEVIWDVSERATSGPHWTGRLDRSKMALTIDYTEGDLTRLTWNESFAPTSPRG